MKTPKVTQLRSVSAHLCTGLLLAFAMPLIPGHAQDTEFKADEHTLLLCHFEQGLTADHARGTAQPTVSGPVSIVSGGKFGKAAQIQKDGWLRYLANDGNFDVKQGTIEFWLKPDWSAYEGRIERLINLVDLNPTRNFSLYILDEGKLVCQMVWYDKDMKVVSQRNIVDKIDDTDFFKNRWHHIALMWQRDNPDDNKGKFWLRIDGKKVGTGMVTGAMLFKEPPPYLDILSLHVGAASTGLVDELRISDIRRYKDPQ